MTDSEIWIESIHVGTPRVVSGPNGNMTTSICRTRSSGPVMLNLTGLEGDAVSNKEAHGWPNMAVCCHSMENYRFWQQSLGLDMPAGWVGENWTLENASEDAICLMDVYDVGEARIQVSKPRVPCQKQSWRVGRKDWIDLVIRELRTGFYLQVFTAGLVNAGDRWRLVERSLPEATVQAVNRCLYHEYDDELARQLRQIDPPDPNMSKKLDLAENRLTRMA